MIASAILQLSVKCLGKQETNTVYPEKKSVQSLGGKNCISCHRQSPINYSQTADENHPDVVLLINAQNQWVKCINVLNK